MGNIYLWNFFRKIQKSLTFFENVLQYVYKCVGGITNTHPKILSLKGDFHYALRY